MCIVPFSGATLLALAARSGYPFEMAVHFRPQYLVVGGVVTVLALPLRAWRLAGIAGVTAAWNLAVILMVPPAAPALAQTDGGEIVVVWSNLHSDPAAAQVLAGIALAQHADAVLAAETTDAVREMLTRELVGYACQSLPPDHAWGVAAFAHGDCAAFESVKAPGDAIYRDYWEAHLKIQGVDLRGVHVYTPLSAMSEVLRDRQIAWAAQPRAPGLAVGDFNASPWSPPILDLQRNGLQRIACGGPFAPTFPAEARLIGVPIDHGFVTPGLAARCEVGPATGSDHYPLIIRLSHRP